MMDGLFAGGGMARRFARRGLDLVLPPRALDDRAAVASPGMTANAWGRLAFIDAPVCDRCGAPLEYDIGEGGACAACEASGRRSLDRVRAACLYDEHSRELILQLKHADRTDLAALFAVWLARAAADILPSVDAVLAVPLHRWRLLRRRYNQAAEIARPLARSAGRAYLPDALVRARATRSQEGRSADGRRRNVAGAFAVRRPALGTVAGRRLLLVDDVMTTGATAEACARALRKAGAAGVDLVVIARVKEAPTHAI